MDMINKKNILIIFVFTSLFVFAVIGGIYIAQQSRESLYSSQNASQTSNDENDSKSKSIEDESLYKEILKDLDDKDYDSAYKKLVSLKEKNPTSGNIKNLDEIYYYTRAKIYIKENNTLSAKEIISKIKDDYTGLFSKEIAEIKKGLNDSTSLSINNNNGDISTKVIESQKILLSKKENIRIRMNNQIAAIRDKQTREDIAYKEGFLSIKQYYTQKAQNEADIQQIRLNYANEEINAITNTVFNSAEEKNIELNTATAKKSRIEQELRTAHKAQEEVANVSASFDRAMEQLR